MEEEEKPRTLERIEKLLVEQKDEKKKKKKFRLPSKAKVNNKRLKEGYTTIVVIEDNKNIDFVKEPIIDGTIKLIDTFHATNPDDIFSYKGKPIIFLPKRSLNPYNPLQGEHETYGQKYVMARMEGDKIITKKKMGMGLAIGGLIIVALVVYAIFGG